ncbi:MULTISPECIES: serine/threonine-protein kinase [Kitasatospora]|uniref:Putative serine/threonine protein kinase n=1 Tax=Kitasatospora setae (strain ATCC 33774 / DSM 43861 / JCM 3304 / KCC A-0304 / NBRC 14216 / KM-6054) TaxID=452652 RepID=E4NGW0_KITSK|nr:MULTISPECIES: serine/threonine-protein kinase [Kitasatospora]BAJ30740.1 putative serine/threonine protein kinase [Kitasatospora setae KM-6054]
MAADTPQHSAPLPPVFQPLLPDDPREVGGYRLFARLGAGGMGRVYLSYTPGGRPVALKVVRPEFAEDGEFRRRFAQEVSSAQRIHGLYTAQVIDSGGLESGSPWLVTSYVPGPSLQQVVREHGALPVRTVLLLLGGIAEALQAIHSVRVVHRDLKPANVLVASDGPRVIDFGIARAADATALTGTGYRIGSPAFMSPEQAQGKAITPATDVFALGALAAYVAGGAPPFGDGPDTAVLYRVVHEEPDLSTVPAPLRELVGRCLAKDPAERPTPAEIILTAQEHPEVGGQLRFGEDWLPGQVNTEITRRSDLPRTPPTPLPAAPPTAPPLAAPAVAAPPTAPPAVPPAVPAAPLSAPPVAPQVTHQVTHPVAPPSAPPVQPPSGAFGPLTPVSEAVTGPVAPADPTLRLTEQHTPPPAPAAVPLAAEPAPAPAPAPAGKTAKAEKAERRGGVSWKTLLVVALVTLLAGTTGGLVLMKQLSKDDKANTAGGSSASQSPVSSPNAVNAGTGTGTGSQDQAVSTPSAGTQPKPSGSASGSASASPSPSARKSGSAAGFTAVYTDRELSVPNRSYGFDLLNGKVNTASGMSNDGVVLRPGYSGLEVDSGYDQYVGKGDSLTPQECSDAIDKNPSAGFTYGDLSPGRLICVRNRQNWSVGVMKVLNANTDGAVSLSLSYYRYNG